MWDFRHARFAISDKMRYDTPGDYEGDLFVAWSGLPELSQRAVQLHEFIEATILRAAGVTDEQIDTIDNYRDVTRHYADSSGNAPGIWSELGGAAKDYEAVPKAIHNLYEQAHVMALLVERAFLEAAGGNWKEHDDLIEASRGKIPIRQGDSH